MVPEGLRASDKPQDRDDSLREATHIVYARDAFFHTASVKDRRSR